VSPPRSPSARGGIRNAALRAAPAAQAAVPPVLQPDAEPGSVPQVRDESAQVTRRPVRPTRITVDLVADLHGFLRGYAQARDVAAADVIRELIRQLKADPGLSSRVSTELERRREALAAAMQAARE
jgi:hypothetical protein